MIDFKKYEYYVREEWANLHPKVRTGDLLIVQTGDIGQVGLVTEEYNECNCHAVIIARTSDGLIVPAFLTYYFLSNPGKELLLSQKTGALLPHLNSSKIKAVAIPLPGKPIQREIIDYLDRKTAQVDSLVSDIETQIKKLKEYRQAIISEAVTGKVAI